MSRPAPSEDTPLRAADAARGGADAFDAFVRAALGEWVWAALLQAAAAPEALRTSAAEPGARAASAAAAARLRSDREGLAAAVADMIRARLTEVAAAAPTTAAPALRLIDEEQIDEDIEIARLVQAIESECEAELRAFAALVSGLRGLPGVDRAALPLPPLACAAGLRDGLRARVPEADVRLALLRLIGAALGRELRVAYRRLADGLKLQGVQPAQYRVMQAPPPPPRPSLAAAPVGDAARGDAGVAATALGRLVELARAAGGARVAGPAADAGLRLLDDPLPAGRAASASLEASTAAQLMERLLVQVGRQLGGTHGADQLVDELREPARLLAAREPRLWASPGHPWWQFLDRLMAVGSVHDEDEESGLVTRSLGLVGRRLRESGPLDHITCQVAVDGLNRLAERRLQERRSRLNAQARGLQRAADAQDLQLALRDQIAAQLRSTAASAPLRRFLVGPWAQAMAHAAQINGLHSPELDVLAEQVDTLLRATARPGRTVPAERRAELLGRASDALAAAGFAATRIEAELATLEAVLRDPPPPDEPSLPTAYETLPDAMDLHGGLPTVPQVPMVTGFDTTLEVAGHAIWLDTLQPGSYCRMFLRDRWMNVQLSWVSPTRNLFVFDSRRRDGTHALTRRMLARLRNAGLATGIEDGALLAMAADTLAQTDFGGAR